MRKTHLGFKYLRFTGTERNKMGRVLGLEIEKKKSSLIKRSKILKCVIYRFVFRKLPPPLLLKNSDFLVFLPTKFGISHILPPTRKSVKMLPPLEKVEMTSLEKVLKIYRQRSLIT